jgi:nucleoid DNA-binding protein
MSRVDKKRQSRYTGTDLVKGLSHLEGISEAQAKSILDHLIEQIILSLLQGNKVYLPKLGSFYLVTTRPKEGVHPKTLEPLVVEPSLKARFSPSHTLTSVVKEHAERFLKTQFDSMSDEEKERYNTHKEEVISRVANKVARRGVA